MCTAVKFINVIFIKIKVYVKLKEVPEYTKQLINLRVSLEERVPGSHLWEDTADWPDIYRTGVAGGAQQNFWSSVPQGHNLVTALYKHKYKYKKIFWKPVVKRRFVSNYTFAVQFVRNILVHSLWKKLFNNNSSTSLYQFLI